MTVIFLCCIIVPGVVILFYKLTDLFNIQLKIIKLPERLNKIKENSTAKLKETERTIKKIKERIAKIEDVYSKNFEELEKQYKQFDSLMEHCIAPIERIFEQLYALEDIVLSASEKEKQIKKDEYMTILKIHIQELESQYMKLEKLKLQNGLSQRRTRFGQS